MPAFYTYLFESAALRGLVRAAWGVSYPADAEPMPGIIAPDTHVEFLFQAGAPCTTCQATGTATPSPRAMIFGLRHGALRLQSTGANSIVGFRVAPAVASAIVGRQLVDCWDRPVALTELIGDEADALIERIAAVPLAAAGAVIEAWLLARLAGWTAENERNLRLQNALIWHVGGKSLSTLADEAGVTLRTLRRHCEKHAGLSPKQLAMSGRMLRASVALLDRPALSIADIAHGTGFNDQPAFANAFRHYVGMTPGGFRAEPIVHCERPYG